MSIVRIFSAAKRAFTLIELLIVVAIIAILAAIAVPNFLEAQVRAKVSRCKSDMRTIATGLEVYYVDYNRYPPYGRITPPDADGNTTESYPATQNNKFDTMCFIGECITTPVAYIVEVPEDVFYLQEKSARLRQFEYMNVVQHVSHFPPPTSTFYAPWMDKILPAWGMWRMVAAGPDLDRGLDIKNNIVYDPTNGTVSDGDIVRCQRMVDSKMNTMAP
jgi:prepilin-type N-terminal cleavage/methylation domain-containing protein